MATAVVSKKFPAKTGAPQIKWLLKKRGPMTIWEIVDELKAKQIHPTYANVQRSLLRLREKGEAGVCNFKKEEKRRKSRSRRHYDYRIGQYLYNEAGEKLRGTEYVDVWSIANEIGEGE